MMQALSEFLSGLSLVSVALRLVLATLFGAAIGFDRRIKNYNAGIRTHALVCLGSALVMMTSEFVALTFPQTNVDITRIGSQVVSGIGFLGAGTIIVTGRNRVHGLSSAAGIWACACIGLALGIGFLEGAVVAVVLVVAIKHILNRLDNRLRRHTTSFDLYVEFESQAAVRDFTESMRDQHVNFYDLRLRSSQIPDDGPIATMSIELPSYEYRKPFLRHLKSLDGVRYFELM